MFIRLPFYQPLCCSSTTRKLLGNTMGDIVESRTQIWRLLRKGTWLTSLDYSSRTSSVSSSSITAQKPHQNLVRDKKLVPDSDPPSLKDVHLLYNFLDQSSSLVVLTGAGISTECGIPDYRSPNGAYSSGCKPITHQEFVRSTQCRRRYWATSYAGWRQFTATQPSPAHFSLASLEKVGRIKLLITQNVDRLHHRAGSNPLELHATDSDMFRWAEAIESLHDGRSGLDKSFGMKHMPDGDNVIEEKFWEDFCVPSCQMCDGVLKPDVVFCGGNIPMDRANKAMAAATNCDAFLVLGSSVTTMSAFRLVRAAHEAGAATGIVNIGATRADDFVSLKISARLGEIMPRVLQMGSLTLPALQSYHFRPH